MVARQLGPSLLLMLLLLLLLALRQETLQVTDATYGARRLRSVGQPLLLPAARLARRRERRAVDAALQLGHLRLG